MLIADVGEDVVEDGQARFVGRHVQPGLGHQGHQPHRLQADRLAAGVGAGDEDDKHVLLQRQVRRHHRLGVKQRVAGGFDPDSGAGVQVARRGRPVLPHLAVAGRLGLRCAPPLDKARLDGVDRQGVVGAGEDRIQLGYALDDALDSIALVGHLFGEFAQDALNLLLLLHQQAAILVIEFHRAQWLDPQRRPAAALVVDDALEPAFGVGAQGDDVPAAALGDNPLLQELGHAAVEDALQLILNLAVNRALLLAQLGQAQAGAVEHLAALVERAADGADDAAALLDQHGDGRQMGHARLLPQQLAAQVAPGDDRGLNRQKVLGRQRKAAQGVIGRAPHVARPAADHAAVALEQRHGLARPGLPLARLGHLRRRVHGQRQFASAAEAGIAGDDVADLVKFQNGE